jgi:hypothetical protein
MILRLLSILPFAWQLPLSEIKCASLRISILLPMIAAIIYLTSFFQVNNVGKSLFYSHIIRWLAINNNSKSEHLFLIPQEPTTISIKNAELLQTF